MKGLFGLVGLLLALAIVGLVVKKQLDATQQIVPSLTPAAAPPGAADPAPPPATVREQSQQVQQQYKQAVEAAMQPVRPVPGDK